MLAACKDGQNVLLREAPAQCTAAEIAEFWLVVIKENLPYDRSVFRCLPENNLEVSRKDEILVTACDARHHDIVKLLLASGASANFLGIDRSRPVHHAAGRLDVLETLAGSGANFAFRNSNGETVLHLASARGGLDWVKWLLGHEVSIDAKTGHDHGALHDAAQAGHDLVFQHLLQSGADFGIRTRHTRSTPLHYAAECGHLEVVETLLNFEYDLLARDAGGGTPLHTASCWGHVDVVEKLLEAVRVKKPPVIDAESSDTLPEEVLLPDETATTEEV